MSITVDLITRKKLILIRQLYQHAVIQSDARHSYVSRIMALIGFDLAAETVLKAIVSALDPIRIPSDGFQNLVQQADDQLHKAGLTAVPDKANIQHVHSIRNDAQHKAKYPNETDVSDCRTYVRDFLQKIICNVWNLAFESISLTEVIQHERVRNHLAEAETALISGDYIQALIKSEVGLGMALGLVSRSIVGSVPNATAFLIADTFGAVKSDAVSFETFKHMRGLLLRFVLGLSYADHIRYRQIVDSIIELVFYGDWNYQVNLPRGKQPEQKEAEFVVTYAVNAVIQIESQVGNLDAPYTVGTYY